MLRASDYRKINDSLNTDCISRTFLGVSFGHQSTAKKLTDGLQGLIDSMSRSYFGKPEFDYGKLRWFFP